MLLETVPKTGRASIADQRNEATAHVSPRLMVECHQWSGTKIICPGGTTQEITCAFTMIQSMVRREEHRRVKISGPGNFHTLNSVNTIRYAVISPWNNRAALPLIEVVSEMALKNMHDLKNTTLSKLQVRKDSYPHST